MKIKNFDKDNAPFDSSSTSSCIKRVKNTIHKSLRWLISTISAISYEIFIIALCALNYFRNLEKKDLKEPIQAEKIPLLLIHGLYHNSSAWSYFKNELSKQSVGPIFTINLKNPFGSIVEHAKKVQTKIEKIKALTGRNDIVLVGHSMGGLVACQYALELNVNKNTQVKQIITLGSPLEGTYTAYLGIGKSCYEMRRNSPFINQLSKQIKQESNISFLHVASMKDAIILPNSSALLLSKTNGKRKKIFNLSHLSLLYSKKIVKEVFLAYTSLEKTL